MLLNNKIGVAALIISITTLYVTPTFQVFLPESLKSSVLIDLLKPEKANITVTSPPYPQHPFSRDYTQELISRTNTQLSTSPNTGTSPGPGSFVFDDGSSFVGLFDNNGKFMRGKFITKDYTFDGSFKDNNDFDYGTLEVLKENGYSYTGTFQNNLPDGRGLIKFPNGSIFEGEFSKGYPVKNKVIQDGQIVPITTDNSTILEEKARRSPIRFPNSP